jgi:glycine cleavage system H protein
MKSHEWAKLEGDSVVLGITDYAVKHLSDLVFLDLPAVGKKLTSGQSFAEIESVKAVSDIYAPISGQVIAVNEDLVDNLDRLNSDPFGAGWMVKVKIDGGNLDSLLSAEAYQAHLQTQPE